MCRPPSMLGSTFHRRCASMITLDSRVSSEPDCIYCFSSEQPYPRIAPVRRAAMSCPYSTAAGTGRQRFSRLTLTAWASFAFYSAPPYSRRSLKLKAVVHDKTPSLGLLPILFGEPWVASNRSPRSSSSIRPKPSERVKIKRSGLKSIFFGEPWAAAN